MRILSLAPFPPFLACPPVSGGAMHIVRPLIALGETGRYLISLLFPALSPDHVHQVTNYLQGRRGFERVSGVIYKKELNNSSGLREWLPDGAFHLYTSSGYREALAGALRDRFDIVVLETSYLLWAVPLIREIQPWARIVLDLQNVEHLLLQRMVESGSPAEKEKYLFEYRKTLDWERRLWPTVDYCMAVSSLEAEIFNSHAPLVPVGIVVAGGGVDLGSVSGSANPGVSPLDI